MKMEKQKRMRGAFLGLAYGDIISCPTRPLGEHSNDTQKAMALALTCLQPGGFNKDTLAQFFVTGFGRKSAGIGAAMRIAPAAIVYHRNLNQLRKVVAEQSAMTHADIRVITLAYTVAYVTAQFINGVSREDILKKLPGEIFDFEDFVLEKYKDRDMVTEGEHDVSMTLSYVLVKDIDRTDYIRERILDMLATDSLAGGIHAIIMGMQTKVDPNEQILSICRLGSTDTVAAITGTILGARFGDEWMDTHIMIDEKRINAYADSFIIDKPCESVEEFIEKVKAHSK